MVNIERRQHTEAFQTILETKLNFQFTFLFLSLSYRCLRGCCGRARELWGCCGCWRWFSSHPPESLQGFFHPIESKSKNLALAEKQFTKRLLQIKIKIKRVYILQKKPSNIHTLSPSSPSPLTCPALTSCDEDDVALWSLLCSFPILLLHLQPIANTLWMPNVRVCADEILGRERWWRKGRRKRWEGY